VFVPVAIETRGTWHHQAVELVQEIGRRTANIIGHLFVSAAVCGTTEGKCGLIPKHVHSQQHVARCDPLFHFLNVLMPTCFMLVGQKIIIITALDSVSEANA